MIDSKSKDKAEREPRKVKGLSYDGRKDQKIRAMVPYSYDKYKRGIITEDHESFMDPVEGISYTLFLKHQLGMKSKH